VPSVASERLCDPARRLCPDAARTWHREMIEARFRAGLLADFAEASDDHAKCARATFPWRWTLRQAFYTSYLA